MDPRTAIDTILARQHGLITRRQAVEQGMTGSGVAHLLRSGRWEALGSAGVLRLVGSPETETQAALAAVLDSDGALSGPSAAAWWGLPGFVTAPNHVWTTRRGRYRHDRLAIVHTTRILPDHHLASWRSVPVVTPSRLAFELAGTVHPARLERLVDTAWAKALVSGPSLRRVLDDLARRGRSGISDMRAILAERPDRHRPHESGLEARFAFILRRDGQDPMERQVDIGGAEWLGTRRLRRS